jgi:hypothetical protein
MATFMTEGGVIALTIAEGLKRRHLDVIIAPRIIGAVAAMPDKGVRGGKKMLGVFNAGQRLCTWGRLGVVTLLERRAATVLLIMLQANFLIISNICIFRKYRINTFMVLQRSFSTIT